MFEIDKTINWNPLDTLTSNNFSLSDDTENILWLISNYLKNETKHGKFCCSIKKIQPLLIQILSLCQSFNKNNIKIYLYEIFDIFFGEGHIDQKIEFLKEYPCLPNEIIKDIWYNSFEDLSLIFNLLIEILDVINNNLCELEIIIDWKLMKNIIEQHEESSMFEKDSLNSIVNLIHQITIKLGFELN